MYIKTLAILLVFIRDSNHKTRTPPAKKPNEIAKFQKNLLFFEKIKRLAQILQMFYKFVLFYIFVSLSISIIKIKISLGKQERLDCNKLLFEKTYKIFWCHLIING